MVYQSINEKISVAGIYSQAKFVPKKFKWKTREYLIDEITFVHDIKDGGVKKRVFSVLAQGNVYRICFDRDRETWFLEEVWCE